MSDLNEFRQTAREWLETHCPDEMRAPVLSVADYCWGGRRWGFASDAQRLWLERMIEKRWVVPDWPEELGGAALSKAEVAVLREEMARIGARAPLSGMGLWMLAPALLKFGSQEQKRRHLLPIARGEIRWCQGFSEPGAGSDLAGLSTYAEDRGDHYIVNGQKIWTSQADESDAIFCLVRTDRNASKWEGIGFLLIDMSQDGVSTRPIRLISGASSFCETFFTNARAEKVDLVGQPNQGWAVAKYVLLHERETLGALLGAARPFDPIASAVTTLGTVHGRLNDPVLRTKLAAHDLQSLGIELLSQRYLDETRTGRSFGSSASVLKYLAAECAKEMLDLAMQAEGFASLAWPDAAQMTGGTPSRWLRGRGLTIEGGTSEIQLNIIAKRILELPTQP